MEELSKEVFVANKTYISPGDAMIPRYGTPAERVAIIREQRDKERNTREQMAMETSNMFIDRENEERYLATLEFN